LARDCKFTGFPNFEQFCASGLPEDVRYGLCRFPHKTGLGFAEAFGRERGGVRRQLMGLNVTISIEAVRILSNDQMTKDIPQISHPFHTLYNYHKFRLNRTG
jgi:hypothetical protein